MLKIGILSFGEAGSQVAEYAFSKGFPVVVANTAQVDLEKLKQIPSDCKVHLSGWEGAGRNRTEGKEAAISSIEILAEKVEDKLSVCDIVFVAGSCAGGTGSGGLPVGIEIVSEFKEYVGVITILPEIGESIKAQMNTLECFSELSQFEQLSSIFVIDNEKIKQVHGDKDKKQRYNLSNSELIDNLIEVGNLTRQSSYVSNFDKNDLLEIINERGCSTINKIHIPIDDIGSENDFANAIKRSWMNNMHPNGEQGQIVKAGILAKLPQSASKLVNLNLIFEEAGMPYDIMEAYYDNYENSNHFTVYTVLSGLSFPNDRLNQIEKIAKEAEEKISKQIEESRTQKFDTDSWTSKFNRKRDISKPKESLKDRLAKFK